MRCSRPFKLYALCFAVAFIGLGSLYWLKSAMGVNLARDTSIGTHFPFSLFRFEEHTYQEYGPVDVKENFDTYFFYKTHWQHVHTIEHDAISVERIRTGSWSSPSLQITSKSDHWWHVSHRHFYAVRENDRFRLKATLLNSGEAGYGEVQVNALNAEKQILQRGRWHLGTTIRDTPVQVEKTFTVPAGVAYIRLRVAGEGPGRFEYDNLRLMRLPSHEPPETKR